MDEPQALTLREHLLDDGTETLLEPDPVLIRQNPAPRALASTDARIAPPARSPAPESAAACRGGGYCHTSQ